MIKLTGQAGSVAVPVEYTYLRVIAEVEGWIGSGRYAPGEALPPIRQLAEELHTSVGTVRRALDLLKDRGVLEGRQGLRVYVAERPNG